MADPSIVPFPRTFGRWLINYRIYSWSKQMAEKSALKDLCEGAEQPVSLLHWPTCRLFEFSYFPLKSWHCSVFTISAHITIAFYSVLEEELVGEIAEAYESWVLIQDKATLKNKQQQQQQKQCNSHHNISAWHITKVRQVGWDQQPLFKTTPTHTHTHKSWVFILTMISKSYSSYLKGIITISLFFIFYVYLKKYL